MGLRKIILACDLKDNPELIKEYKFYHQQDQVWPEITESIKAAGILNMEIYNIGNRLFMIMEVDDAIYDAKKKAEMDAANPKVKEWENLMMNYQQLLPFPGVDTKWVELEKIFELQD